MRAVVVGAGIGGLATAIALERAGVEPVVIERAPELHEAGFGLVLSANAVTALRSLGLLDDVAARGTRVRRAEIRNPHGELLTLIDYEALGWETYGILRAELQRAMLEVAPTERLRLGTTCVDVTEDGQVFVEGGDPVIGDIVVGADGIRSAVRRSLFGVELLRYGGHRAWRAGTRFDDERTRDRFVEVWGVGGGFGFGPAGAGRVYWYCFEAVPEGAPAPEAARGVPPPLRRVVRTDSRADRVDRSRRHRADVHVRPTASSHLGPRPRDAARRRCTPDEAEHRPGSRAVTRGRRGARLVRRGDRRLSASASSVRAPAYTARKRRRARIASGRAGSRTALSAWGASTRRVHEGATRPPRDCATATDRRISALARAAGASPISIGGLSLRFAQRQVEWAEPSIARTAPGASLRRRRSRSDACAPWTRLVPEMRARSGSSISMPGGQSPP
jgi:2-polyprenyl-6-methoxyphenol hydroxylase-like FAD-dependent oxidoreductase